MNYARNHCYRLTLSFLIVLFLSAPLCLLMAWYISSLHGTYYHPSGEIVRYYPPSWWSALLSSSSLLIGPYPAWILSLYLIRRLIAWVKPMSGKFTLTKSVWRISVAFILVWCIPASSSCILTMTRDFTLLVHYDKLFRFLLYAVPILSLILGLILIIIAIRKNLTKDSI